MARRTLMTRLALIVAMAWMSIPSCTRAAAAPSRTERFEEVWRTVRDSFYDPKFNGANWEGVRKEFAPLAAEARSEEEFASIINTMLSRLRTSHTRFYTAKEPEYFQMAGIFWPYLGPKIKGYLKDGKPDYAGIGLTARQIDGRIFIHHVFDGGPAAQADLRAGDEILSVDGAPYRAVESFKGKIGKQVIVKIRRVAGAEPMEIRVTPRQLDPATMFVDAMKASVEVVELNGKKIGYVHVWNYAGDKYQGALEMELNGRLRDADALVVDLREGWGGASPRFLWPFLAPPLHLELTGRDGKRTSLEEAWTKPVGMLVNEGSRSGKELLTYYFKKAKRGPIIGARTAGAVVAGQPFVMMDGSLLLLAVIDYQVDGARLEATGVTPDVEVARPIEYSAGADPQKQRALEVMAAAAAK